MLAQFREELAVHLTLLPEYNRALIILDHPNTMEKRVTMRHLGSYETALFTVLPLRTVDTAETNYSWFRGCSLCPVQAT